MKHRRSGALLTALVVLGGCARGAFVEDSAGAGGGTPGTTTGATTSGMTTSSTSSASTSAASTSASSSSASSSVASSSSSGVMCNVNEHLCSGACAGNTIETGCVLSVTCAPCPAPPAHGMEVCTAAGQCDFTCANGYNKVGAACACATQCCGPADCDANQTCNNGTCMNMCDNDDCQASCLLDCFPDFGVGACNGGTCNCVCL